MLQRGDIVEDHDGRRYVVEVGSTKLGFVQTLNMATGWRVMLAVAEIASVNGEKVVDLAARPARHDPGGSLRADQPGDRQGR